MQVHVNAEAGLYGYLFTEDLYCDPLQLDSLLRNETRSEREVEFIIIRGGISLVIAYIASV